jgi:LacI family transcriptional regulator
VASRAGVSIASVSRVLNGQGRPRAETRERVLRAVRDLGFVPDGAARALSNGLKEVVGVVFRRGSETPFVVEDECLLFVNDINLGIEVAAHHHGFDVLVSSVGVHDRDVSSRLAATAGKVDGLILHDRLLPASGLARLAGLVPIVTLAGTPTPASMNVRCDNESGMRQLVRHLVLDHGYRSLAYLAGNADSPDNRARARALEAEARLAGAEVQTGPAWQGDYRAAGGAQVIAALLDAGAALPRAVVCANDQTALGVMHALGRRGIGVPGDVAVTGFDDIPVARHLHPPLTTVRQSLQQMGACAFEVLHRRISAGGGEPDIVFPVQLVIRESCGCAPAPGLAGRAPDDSAVARAEGGAE